MLQAEVVELEPGAVGSEGAQPTGKFEKPRHTTRQAWRNLSDLKDCLGIELDWTGLDGIAQRSTVTEQDAADGSTVSS